MELFVDDREVKLDPRKSGGLSFVSHAHSDHVPSKVSGEVISTLETGELARKEGFSPLRYGERLERGEVSFWLQPSGHMLGSSQVVIENGFKVLYTGDLKLEGGKTSVKAEVESCDVLIIESTFGSPFYRLPSKEEVVKEVKDWADDCFARGTTPVLLGYSLGKAQEIVKLFSSSLSLNLHPAIYRNCRKYEALGMELGSYDLYQGEVEEDSVLLFPPQAKNSLKGNYEKALMSGWAMHGSASFKFGVEEAFPFSDHSDFDSLVGYVEKASPQVVYTFHGFGEEFAEELRSRGFYAQPLKKKQSRLDYFL